MTTTQKTLVRIPEKGQIAGVCAGLADYFDVDVTLVRVVFVIVAVATGGLLVLGYLLLALIVPVRNPSRDASDDSLGEKVQQLSQDMSANNGTNRLRNYFGFGLLILGIWLLLQQLFPQYLDLRWEFVWPVLLILAGLLIVGRRK